MDTTQSTARPYRFESLSCRAGMHGRCTDLFDPSDFSARSCKCSCHFTQATDSQDLFALAYELWNQRFSQGDPQDRSTAEELIRAISEAGLIPTGGYSSAELAALILPLISRGMPFSRRDLLAHFEAQGVPPELYS